MYCFQIAYLINHYKVFEISSRLFEFCALNIRCLVYKKNDDNETLTYFLKSIKEASTVLDIGSHDEEYLFFILKMAKRAGKLIAFENELSTYNYLFEKREILKLKKVDIKTLAFSCEAGRGRQDLFVEKHRGAKVVDFNAPIKREATEIKNRQTLDNYCINHNIRPDFVKIDGDGNELAILNGAVKTLQKYRPTILLECEDRREGRSKILQTFKFFIDLNYCVYFIFDT